MIQATGRKAEARRGGTSGQPKRIDGRLHRWLPDEPNWKPVEFDALVQRLRSLPEDQWVDLHVFARMDRLAALEAQCGSDLERQVLRAIQERGLPLPDEAQKTLYDADAPVAIADFYYEPRIVVFVDGSPHHLDYVQAADDWKRRRLRALGYRIVVVRGEDLDVGQNDLATRLNT